MIFDGQFDAGKRGVGGAWKIIERCPGGRGAAPHPAPMAIPRGVAKKGTRGEGGEETVGEEQGVDLNHIAFCNRILVDE